MWPSMLSCVLTVLFSTPVAFQPTALQPNAPVKKAIGANEARDYSLTSQGNQRLRVIVDQQGIDLVVSVVEPNGTKMFDFDSPNGPDGPEDVAIRALKPGTYRITVAPFEKDAKPGAYTITLAESHSLTSKELADIEAETAILAAEKAWDEAFDRWDGASRSKQMRDDAFALPVGAPQPRNKDQVDSNFARGKQVAEKFGATRTTKVTDQQIRVFGDTAVSTGRTITSVKVKEQSAQVSNRFLHLWRKDASGWRLIFDHYYAYDRFPTPKPTGTIANAPLLSSFEGTYRLLPGGSLVLQVAQEGKLAVQFVNLTGSGNATLVPLSDSTFVTPEGDLELTFVRNSSGQITELLLLSDGPAVRTVKER